MKSRKTTHKLRENSHNTYNKGPTSIVHQERFKSENKHKNIKIGKTFEPATFKKKYKNNPQIYESI